MIKNKNTRSARGATTRTRTRRRNKRRPPARAYGLQVEFRIERRFGAGRTRRYAARLGRFSSHPASAQVSRVLDGLPERGLCRAAACLGHPRRLAILGALLKGATTHKDISRLVRLKTGPLYFHIRGLERAGLVQCGERNRYEVTDLAERAVLALAAAMPRSRRKG